MRQAEGEAHGRFNAHLAGLGHANAFAESGIHDISYLLRDLAGNHCRDRHAAAFRN